MSAATDIFENTLLETLSTDASTLHLYTADPGEDDSGTEVSDASYVEQSISFNTAASGSMTSDGAITFPAFDGAVTVSHWGIQNASDVLLVYGAITGGSIAADAGDQIKFADEALVVSCD